MQTDALPLTRFTSTATGIVAGILRIFRLVFDRKRSEALALDDIGMTQVVSLRSWCANPASAYAPR